MELCTKNLTEWDNTRNGISINHTVTEKNIDNKVSLAMYLSFFKQALERNSLVHAPARFCKHWASHINDFRKKLYIEHLSQIVGSKNVEIGNVEKYKDTIFHKFQGNVGEILIEALVRKHLFGEFEENYTPSEDRQHEDYTDATALDVDGMKVGIQIKNYTTNNVDSNIAQKWFTKASTMGLTYAKEYSEKHPETVAEYLQKPRQYVISFTGLDTGAQFIYERQFQQLVRFIGPKTIEQRVVKLTTMKHVFEDIIAALEEWLV